MYDDSQFLSSPAYFNPPPFKVKPKAPLLNRDGEYIPKPSIEDMEPEYATGADPNVYNPFNHPIKLIHEQMNLELLVQFYITNDNLDKLQTITFVKDGVKIELPFFPSESTAGLRIEGQPPTALHHFYLEDEDTVYMYPGVVRAKVYGDGVETEDVLMDEKWVKENVSPCMLDDLINAYYNEAKEDSKAPIALIALLEDFCHGRYDC